MASDSPDFIIGSTAEMLDDHLGDIQPGDPSKPRVAFPSDLVLTRAQEDALCERAKKWHSLLDDQLGRTDTAMDGMDVPAFLSGQGGSGGTGQTRPERKFFAKRLLYQLINENKMDFRAILNPQSIFATSNLVVPLARRIASQMGARLVNYFFDTDPWMAQFPVGGEGDKLFAQKLQKFTDVKFTESGSLARLRRALPISLVIGESVMKVTQTRRAAFYRQNQIVAVGPDKKPLLAGDGMPITQQDTLTMAEDGTSVLARDGTPIPEGGLTFAQVLLDQEIVFYEGPEVTQIYYRDFLCPENASCIQDAECVIHMMERTASSLAQAYMQSPDKTLEETQAAVGAIRDAMSGSHQAKSGDRSARSELGQQESLITTEAVTEYGEFYIRMDADGDLIEEDIMLVMNPATGYPIYYNYVANVTDDGLRPFRAIVPKPVLNRWYGQGAIEQFEVHQETVDLMVNRRNRGQGESGRVTFWCPENTYEGENNPSLSLNRGATYRLIPNRKVEDTLQVVYLDDNKYDTLTRDLEFFMQLAMNESGVQHANDGNAAGSDTTKLAAGIRNIEKSGQELFGVVISEVEGGVTSIAEAFVTTLYANMDEEEVFQFFEGDVPVEMTLSGKDVKHLKFNVRTLLTRYRDEQTLASNSQGYAILFGAVPYYSLPPEMQVMAAGFVRDQLKALQIPRADEYVIPQAVPLMAAGGAPSPQGVPKVGNTPPPNI